MQTEESAEKRRWLVAVSAGVVLTALAGALFRAPVTPPAGRPAAPHPSLVLAPADTLLREETALHDPAPLFEPTEWNSRPEPPARDPGIAFASYPPEYTYSPDHLSLTLPSNVPARPAEALVADSPGNPLLGLGRTDTPVPVMAPRGAFVEIVAAGTGISVLSTPLADARPPEGEGVLWRPLEFLAAVDATGLVGPLVLCGPSNIEAVNSYFERYLTQVFRVGDRLAPGFYHIRVGP